MVVAGLGITFAARIGGRVSVRLAARPDHQAIRRPRAVADRRSGVAQIQHSGARDCGGQRRRGSRHEAKVARPEPHGETPATPGPHPRRALGPQRGLGLPRGRPTRCSPLWPMANARQPCASISAPRPTRSFRSWPPPHTQAGKSRQKNKSRRPRVLILPGIMGSKLGGRIGGPAARRGPDSKRAGAAEVLWIDPLQIAAGRLIALALPSEAKVEPMGAAAVFLRQIEAAAADRGLRRRLFCL